MERHLLSPLSRRALASFWERPVPTFIRCFKGGRRLPAEPSSPPLLVNPGMVQDTGVRTDVPRVSRSGLEPAVSGSQERPCLPPWGGRLRGRRKLLGEEETGYLSFLVPHIQSPSLSQGWSHPTHLHSRFDL